jgi:hypothetical protein
VNEAEDRFHRPLEDASADFGRECAFVSGAVVGGEGEEVGGISLEARHGIAGYISYNDRGSR